MQRSAQRLPSVGRRLHGALFQSAAALVLYMYIFPDGACSAPIYPQPTSPPPAYVLLITSTMHRTCSAAEQHCGLLQHDVNREAPTSRPCFQRASSQLLLALHLGANDPADVPAVETGRDSRRALFLREGWAKTDVGATGKGMARLLVARILVAAVGATRHICVNRQRGVKASGAGLPRKARALARSRPAWARRCRAMALQAVAAHSWPPRNPRRGKGPGLRLRRSPPVRRRRRRC